jgi:hypothetical protein
LTYGKLFDDYFSLARLIATIMVDGLLHCSGPECALVVTFTPREAGLGGHGIATTIMEHLGLNTSAEPVQYVRQYGVLKKRTLQLLAAVLATVHPGA